MKNDYYKTIDQFDLSPVSPLIRCPKCNGDMNEVYNLKKDGTRKKFHKIIDLHCTKCSHMLSSVKQPKQHISKICKQEK